METGFDHWGQISERRGSEIFFWGKTLARLKIRKVKSMSYRYYDSGFSTKSRVSKSVGRDYQKPMKTLPILAALDLHSVKTMSQVSNHHPTRKFL
ncbi:MAG: hypothetical protein WBB23_09060 [Desulforhopalus sp.]